MINNEKVILAAKGQTLSIYNLTGGSPKFVNFNKNLSLSAAAAATCIENIDNQTSVAGDSSGMVS